MFLPGVFRHSWRQAPNSFEEVRGETLAANISGGRCPEPLEVSMLWLGQSFECFSSDHIQLCSTKEQVLCGTHCVDRGVSNTFAVLSLQGLFGCDLSLTRQLDKQSHSTQQEAAAGSSDPTRLNCAVGPFFRDRIRPRMIE